MLCSAEMIKGLVGDDCEKKCRPIVALGEQFGQVYKAEVNRLAQIEKAKPKAERLPKDKIRRAVLAQEQAELEAAGADKSWPMKALQLVAFKSNGCGAIEQLPYNKAIRLVRLVSPFACKLARGATVEKVKALIQEAKGLSVKALKVKVDTILYGAEKNALKFWPALAKKLTGQNAEINLAQLFRALGADDALRVAQSLWDVVEAKQRKDAELKALADSALQSELERQQTEALAAQEGAHESEAPEQPAAQPVEA